MARHGKRTWFLRALGWDGGLPFLVALSPEILRLFLPGPDAATLISVIFLPMIASLIRAHRGGIQLREVCPDHPAWGRQFLFGLAIVLLLGFEALLIVLLGSRIAAWSPWLLAGAIYLSYLGLVAAALRPGPRSPAAA
jgi:hypothetical protein